MNIFRRIEERVSIFDAAKRVGLDWEDWGRPQQVNCPLHDDRTPSARVYGALEGGYCWTCQRSFGPVALVAAREQVSFPRAAHLLGEWFGIDLTPSLEEEEARRLIDAWEDPKLIGDPNDDRRMAAMLLRPVGMPWGAAEVLLNAYEVLDHTDIEPREWMRWTSTLPTPPI